MAVTTKRSRATVESRQLLIRALFAILILVPVAGLFVEVWQSTDTRKSVALQERLGVQYLGALGPLTAALTLAQSTAVAGGSVDTAGIQSAVAGVADVDGRLGDALRTHERWTAVRGKVEALSKAKPASAAPAYDAYGEVTDLLLALYTTVQENSGLIRDPDADGSELQDAAAQELPRFLVATGRFSDRASMVSGLIGSQVSSKDRVAAFGQLFAARSAVASPAQNLTDDLQAAVTVSQSPTLGSNLFILLDHLRLTMDAVATTPVLDDGDVTPADVYALGSLRARAVEAVNPLSAVMLDELDKLIVTRTDRIGTERGIAIIALALAVVVAFLPVLTLVLAGMWARRRSGPPGRHGLPDSPDDEAKAATARPQPAWSGSGASTAGTWADGAARGSAGSRERERSGAAQ